jgi:tRNA-dihydrouridine synthase B
MVRIGTLQLENPFLQAALSGYTDYPMRILAKRFGCALTLTGVMLDRISLHPKAIKQSKFHCRPDEHPVAAQIFGDDPQVIAQSAVAFRNLGYDMIDLNFACPVPKVLRRERGGWMMRKPYIIREAFQRTRDAVNCPVTMKLRRAYDDTDAGKEDFWTIIDNASTDGVDAIGIHGRTVEQKYKGKADWSVVTEVKKKYPHLTIFGSGDLMDAPTVMQRLHESGIDGVLLARGAVGNPWLFRECIALWAEQSQILLEHFEMIQKIRPGRRGVSFFRKFMIGYLRRLPQRKKALLPFMTVKDPVEFRELIGSWYGIKTDSN